MDCISVMCKLAMKRNLMRICASRLCPFKTYSVTNGILILSLWMKWQV